jgi:hypothetical protein
MELKLAFEGVTPGMTEGEEGTSRCPLASTEPFVSIPLFPVLFGTDKGCWNRRQVPHTTSLR